MKNIHVLPTDKPSKLFTNMNDELSLLGRYSEYKGFISNQNIYITSDEEINQQTNPCWCINTIKNTWNKDLIYYQGAMPQYHFVGFKKIILTTDQDLVKDGVQAIDDEFLEWFVNNPSCDRIKTFKDKELEIQQGISFYGIILPKRESKPFKDMLSMTEASLAEFKKNPIPMKKETLEEAAERMVKETTLYGNKNSPIGTSDRSYFETELRCVLLGMKYQQERSYSEKEVNALITLLKSTTEYEVLQSFRDKVEQFKKK